MKGFEGNATLSALLGEGLDGLSLPRMCLGLVSSQLFLARGESVAVEAEVLRARAAGEREFEVGAKGVLTGVLSFALWADEVRRSCKGRGSWRKFERGGEAKETALKTEWWAGADVAKVQSDESGRYEALASSTSLLLLSHVQRLPRCQTRCGRQGK